MMLTRLVGLLLVSSWLVSHASSHSPDVPHIKISIGHDGSAAFADSNSGHPTIGGVNLDGHTNPVFTHTNLPPGVILPSFDSSGLVIYSEEQKKSADDQDGSSKRNRATDPETQRRIRAEAEAADKAEQERREKEEIETRERQETLRKQHQAEQDRIRELMGLPPASDEQSSQSNAGAIYESELAEDVSELMRQHQEQHDASSTSTTPEAQREQLRHEQERQRQQDEQQRAFDEQQRQEEMVHREHHEQQEQQRQEIELLKQQEREAQEREREAVQQQQQQQHEQPSVDEHDAERMAHDQARRQAESDALRAAAARAYAESQVSTIDAGENAIAMHDPARALLESLQRAAFFRELHGGNGWHYVQQNRPFLVLITCDCPRDSDLDIATLENLVMDAGLHHKFSFLWVKPESVQRFAMVETYGLAESNQPALIIDNIPIGQHVEKYLFPGRIERPHTATPKEMFDWMAAFFQAPTPLSLILRSRRPDDGGDESFNIDNDRGRVFELTGETFRRVVLDSPYTVLVMFYSPTCPGCQSAQPVLAKVAETLAWTNRDVIVAKLDRTRNDVPIVIRFQSYPAIFLFLGGKKLYDTTSNDGELPENRGLAGSRGYRAPIDYYGPTENPRSGDSCNAPLNEKDLESWIQKHTNGGGNLLGMMGGMGTTSLQTEMSTTMDAPDYAETPAVAESQTTPQAPEQAGMTM